MSTEPVPGWPVAFRGSRAVDLKLRSLAAYRLGEGCGVLSGYSAAVLPDAACAPTPGVPAEVTVPGGSQRGHPGMIVHRDRFEPGESTLVGDVRCTSPLRRYTRLVDDGWRICRYTKFEVFGEPQQIVDQLKRARQRTR